MKKINTSILGLYLFDNSIFDNMETPAGIDKTLLTDHIILECSELECLYPDPDFMKGAIQIWSRAEKWNWEHLYNLTQLEYNPIWNKDGTIIETETRNLTNTGSSSDNGSGTNVDSVKGYNESDWAESEKTDAQSQNNSNATNNESGTIEHKRVETGNIGVTTTQTMFLEEKNLISQFNLFNEITKSFKKRFCLLVY